jgi:hypothetical protein
MICPMVFNLEKVCVGLDQRNASRIGISSALGNKNRSRDMMVNQKQDRITIEGSCARIKGQRGDLLLSCRNGEHLVNLDRVDGGKDWR